MTSALTSFPLQGGKRPQQYNHSFKELLECNTLIQQFCHTLSKVYKLIGLFIISGGLLYPSQTNHGCTVVNKFQVLLFSLADVKSLMKQLASSMRTNPFNVDYKQSFLNPHKIVTTCTSIFVSQLHILHINDTWLKTTAGGNKQ